MSIEEYVGQWKEGDKELLCRKLSDMKLECTILSTIYKIQFTFDGASITVDDIPELRAIKGTYDGAGVINWIWSNGTLGDPWVKQGTWTIAKYN